MHWPFVRSVIERDEVASTSDLARELVEGGGQELPLLVRSRRQTKGRGRGSKTWWSDEGSLTFTLALSQAQAGVSSPSSEYQLALAAACAIVSTVGSITGNYDSLGIRWPNDVEWADRKLAGILPEKIEDRQASRVFLLGIGLNLGTHWELAPPDIRRLAVSVRDLAPTADLDPDRVLAKFLGYLASDLANLQRDARDLADVWRVLDTLKGRPVRIDLGSSIVAGVGAGIDDDGALLVLLEQSTVRIFGGQVLREI
jgi:BirA family biotin operon repressor/biotin-[acetyl-CoA-carboxylase] ligase